MIDILKKSSSYEELYFFLFVLFKEKIDKIRSKTKSAVESFSFRELSENVFPYACLVDDDVLLTKNGEVFQMIEILLDDFKLNQEGGLREAVRRTMTQNVNDLKTAFWIQTVKRRKPCTEGTSNVKEKGTFIQYVYDACREYEKHLNNYKTIMYITIVRQGKNFKITHLKDYIFSGIISRLHDKYIDNAIKDVKKITSKMIEDLKIYKPKILSIRYDEGGNEYSELLETLYFLVNFKDKEILISPIDATKVINRSKYLFKNGVMVIQNDSVADLYFAMSFSLKETPCLVVSNVADIINNTKAEIIITEYVSYINKNHAVSHFKEQKLFLQSIEESKAFQDNAGLSFLNDDDDDIKYCQSSLSVMVLAKNMKELQLLISDVINIFTKYGVVMAREDISLERNYCAMMPANFAFVHRLTIHSANDNACFCYSYNAKNNDPVQFLKNTILFNIGTLKGNPVPIGFDKEKPNIIISGERESGKTVMANFLVSSFLREFDANVYIIEFNCKSRVFADVIGGKWFCVSMNKEKHNALFNIMDLNIFHDDVSIENYLIEMFSMLLSASTENLSDRASGEIIKICRDVSEYAKNNKNFALHDVRHILKETSIDQELQCWHSIGRYYHLFDNRENIFDLSNVLAFYIDETVAKHSIIRALIIEYMLVNIIQRAETSNKPTIVVLDEPFLALGDSFFKKRINKIIESAAKNNVYFIFKVSDLEEENRTIVDFLPIINSCGMQMHFANKFADSNYGNVFKIGKLEYMAIKVLSNYDGRNLIVKQKDKLFSCSFDLSKHSKILKILSDSGDTYKQILRIKDELQTESPNRWLQAYLNDFIDNVSIEEQREISQEIQAIQDIRQLLEC